MSNKRDISVFPPSTNHEHPVRRNTWTTTTCLARRENFTTQTIRRRNEGAINGSSGHPAVSSLSHGLGALKNIAGDHCSAPDDEILFDEWDWEIGVGLYGDFRRAEADGDAVALARIGRWYDRMLDSGLPRRHVNSTATLLTLALLAQHEGRGDWVAVVRDWAEWVATQLPRTDEGGYQHTVKERDNDGELWDDTLMMAALFIAAAGRLCQRDDWVDDAHYQFLTHIRFLGDRNSGLFFHGWTFLGRHNFARALWARGNAWLAIAIPELYRIAPPAGAVDRYLREVFGTLIGALLRLQNSEGLWHTLLDDPASPIEASGSAGIAYGMLAGKRERIMPPHLCSGTRAAADRACSALLARIDRHGLLGDVSGGTQMGHDLDFYRDIRNLPTPYGQALGALFFNERIRLG